MSIPLSAYWQLLSRYLRPLKTRMALLAVAIAGGIGTQLISPQIMRTFVDTVVAWGTADPSAMAQRLVAIALTYLAFAVVDQGLSFATTYLSETVAWSATNALRHDLALHCLRLDMPFHKAHTPGKLIERVDGDVSSLASFFSQMAIRFVGSGLLALGILIILFVEDWRIGLAGVAYACLIATAVRSLQRRAVTAWGSSRQADSELFGYIGEVLGATEDIRGNGGEGHVMARLESLMLALRRAWRRAKLVQAFSRAAGSLSYVLTEVGALAIGAALYLSGGMTIGTVYLLLRYFSRLRAPLDQLRHNMAELQRASASIERVQSLLDMRSALTEKPVHALEPGPMGVVFRDVSFGYVDGSTTVDAETVLHRMTFALGPGRVLGLLGRTGGGKTTLARLLFRLYDPSSGSIRVGGADLTKVALSDLRQRVGLVTQDVQLFHGTVRDNVTLFSGEAADESILGAFRELGLWQWFQTLEDGLDTELLGSGLSLSAGEAQLLAFARLFLKDPGLVILDEASSRLDPATERLLERAIDRLLLGRTAIIIAHRLSTVDRADDIMVLEDGRISEYGGREALASDETSRFHHLLETGLVEVLA